MFKRLHNIVLRSYKNSYLRYIQQYKATRAMSTKAENKSGMPLKQVVSALVKYADLSLAASWDNVGLLVEPTESKTVNIILLTNDLTEDVMDEAIELKADLIITYHPLIFAPLKSVTTKSWKERIVARCLENRIAVFSPHTCFDAISGGVNDWLACAFDLENIENIKAIQPSPDNEKCGFGRLCILKNRISINEAVELVKEHTNLKHVRLARARGTDGFIKTVALCAGSGVSVLKEVSADLYLTGEMLHHDVLDAVHRGINVILTNHSDSERGFMYSFAFTLSKILAKESVHVQVSISGADKDPLKTV